MDIIPIIKTGNPIQLSQYFASVCKTVFTLNFSRFFLVEKTTVKRGSFESSAMLEKEQKLQFLIQVLSSSQQPSCEVHECS